MPDDSADSSIFMDYCDEINCYDTSEQIYALISAENKSSDEKSDVECPVAQQLYEGNLDYGYYVGYRDGVVGKLSYLLTLGNLGFTSVSAHFSL